MSRPVRILIGSLLALYGAIGLGTTIMHRGIPTRARAEWVMAQHEASQRGEDPSSVPEPPLSEQFHKAIEWIVMPSAIILAGIALLGSGLKKRTKSEKGNGT